MKYLLNYSVTCFSHLCYTLLVKSTHRDRSPDFGKIYTYIFNLNQIQMPNKLVLNKVA